MDADPIPLDNPPDPQKALFFFSYFYNTRATQNNRELCSRT
jgi:hypothetical protein